MSEKQALYKYLKIESLRHPDMHPVLLRVAGELSIISGKLMVLTSVDEHGDPIHRPIVASCNVGEEDGDNG